MAQMRVADAMTKFALRFYRGGDGAVGRAPRYDEQIAVGIACGNDVRNILKDGFDFCGADAHHIFVVQWFVGDVAGDVFFFPAADAVFKAGSSGNGPWTRWSIGISTIRLLLYLIRPALQ